MSENLNAEQARAIAESSMTRRLRITLNEIRLAAQKGNRSLIVHESLDGETKLQLIHRGFKVTPQENNCYIIEW